MHQKFSDGHRAAAFVGSGVLADFPKAECEVVLEHARGAVRRTCSAQEVGRVVSELCAKFPRASVYYHPDSAYGFAAQVRCHCSTEKAGNCCRANGKERAVVLVIVNTGANDQDSGRRRVIFEQAKIEADERLVEEKKHDHHHDHLHHDHFVAAKKHHEERHTHRKKSLLDWFR